MLARGVQLLSELADPTIASRLPSQCGAPRRLGRHGAAEPMVLVEEQDEMVLTLHAFFGPDRDHLDADLPGPAIHPQPEAFRFHGAPGFDRALDGPAQRHRQALPRHPEELQARLAPAP